MKADSLLTPGRYELVNHTPGTVFDPATMDVEAIDGAPIDALAGEGHSRALLACCNSGGY